MKNSLNRRTSIFTSLAFSVVTFSASASGIDNAPDAQGTRVETSSKIENNVNDSECFPMCKPAAPAAASDSIPAFAIDIEPHKASTCGSASTSLIKQAEQLNDRVTPIKEIVGYIRSPQGLAIKLVNDHVVKIPPWVGYAMDPIGSLKNRAIGELRSKVVARAKSAIGLDSTATGCTVDAPQPPANAALLLVGPDET